MTKLGRILRRLIPFLALISPKADAIEQAPQEPSPAIAALIETIAGASSATRERIANTLARMGEPSIEPLIAALRHRDPKVRGVAARALELMGKDAKRAVPALIASLGDPEPADDPKPTRSSNFPGFGRDGEPRPSPQQRALIEIGEPAIGPLLRSSSTVPIIGGAPFSPSAAPRLRLRRKKGNLSPVDRTAGGPGAPSETHRGLGRNRPRPASRHSTIADRAQRPQRSIFSCPQTPSEGDCGDQPGEQR